MILQVLLGCSESRLIHITGTEEASDLLINKVKRVRVEVIYEEGAEPFTGDLTAGIKTWEITEKNLKLIYANKKASKDVFVPRDLSEMLKIPDQAKTYWTSQELYSLSQKYVENDTKPEEANFVILYVNGHLTESSVLKLGTIGLSIGNSRVVVIFKDSIELAGESSVVRRFMEQSTIVHEIGHAIGLVNKGVRLSSEHQDEAHGAHCTHQDCVMYWLNEGAGNLANFVNNYINEGSIILFGPKCQEDINRF